MYNVLNENLEKIQCAFFVLFGDLKISRPIEKKYGCLFFTLISKAFGKTRKKVVIEVEEEVVVAVVVVLVAVVVVVVLVEV